MARVLKDDTMNTEDKLSTYNKLMTRSQILTSKAKAIFLDPYSNDSPLTAPPHELMNPPDAPSSDEISQEEEEETVMSGKRPIPLRAKISRVKRITTPIPETLAREIEKVPVSYREGVKKLYRLMVTSPKGHRHFSKSGQLMLAGNVKLDETTLTRLLTKVVRPSAKKRDEVPYEREFIGVLKRTNPGMRYIRNKTIHYDISPKREPQQKGEGRRNKPFVLKWSTKL